MTDLTFVGWTASNWVLFITLVTGFASILGLGKFILTSISEMKTDVKKIPVLENQMNMLFQLLERMETRINSIENKANKIERKRVKVDK